ncbi:MAG: hypothetical protein PHX88_08075 [Methanoculleus horonobensis]|nr:hypothetical protein [Methanoculleus horonobensis]
MSSRQADECRNQGTNAILTRNEAGSARALEDADARIRDDEGGMHQGQDRSG